MTPGQHRDSVPHDKSGAQMMPVAHQITGVLCTKHKQRIKIGILESVLRPLQTFPQHALRIESHFPINRNKSNVRQSLFPLK